MNQKGFALTGLLYMTLVIFLVIMITLLISLQNRKNILEQLKADVVDASNMRTDFNFLYNEIQDTKNQNTWKELKVSAGNSVNLPEEFNELSVLVNITSNEYLKLHILKSDITSDVDQIFKTGYYVSKKDSASLSVTINMSKRTLLLTSVYVNEKNIKNAVLKVMYK